jgi:hypothetical protein
MRATVSPALSIVAGMSWVLREGGDRPRRPLLIAEDHLHHVTEILDALAAADPGLLGMTSVLCLDRPGPDTARWVERWLADHPSLQVAAQVAASLGNGRAVAGDGRSIALDPAVFADPHRFARTAASLLRPGGLLLQDIQLETLSFIPKDRWWESIYLASTVRGMFAENPPTCRFLSNKRGYEATFGRDLLDAGFDPRDVMEKSELGERVVPAVRAYLERAFPWKLTIAGAGAGWPAPAVARTEEDRREVEAELDLVAWCGAPGDSGIEIGGRLVAGESRRLVLKAGSQEAATWLALIADRIDGGPGVPVVEVGARIAPEGAGRAEITNLAARHIHGLRSRLADPGGIVTAHHAYRLAEGLRVGRVGRRW